MNYNQWNPPAHGDVIEYVCNAGGHNRFESDFSKSSLEVECLPENQFASVTWPTCVSGELRLIYTLISQANAKFMFIADIQCPDPNGYVTELIMIDESLSPLQLPLQYEDSFRYRNIFFHL